MCVPLSVKKEAIILMTNNKGSPSLCICTQSIGDVYERGMSRPSQTFRCEIVKHGASMQLHQLAAVTDWIRFF